MASLAGTLIKKHIVRATLRSPKVLIFIAVLLLSSILPASCALGRVQMLGKLPSFLAEEYKSVGKRQIQILSFGSGKRTILIMAGVHGDEPQGVQLIGELVKRLKSVPSSLFNQRVIVIPVANPDGLAAGTRVNGHKIDINRNFPSNNFDSGHTSGRYNHGLKPASEPETRAIMSVVDRYDPYLIMSIHSPLQCVNYSGPSEKTAKLVSQMTHLPTLKNIGRGITGSLGDYYGCERKRQVLTVELPFQKPDCNRYVPALMSVIGLTDSTPKSPAASGKVVCIDPGHPSELNSGRTVQNGTTELEMNWQVAQRLAHILRERGVTVVMTKHSRDQFVTNRHRAEIANSSHAAIFLRLHCDTGKGSGITVYYPDRQGVKDGKTGPSPAVIEASKHAATVLHTAMIKTLKGQLADNGIKGDSETAVGRKQGALTGSIYSQVPAVTVEMVFLSDKKDAEFIRSKHGQQALANALAQGTLKYLGGK